MTDPYIVSIVNQINDRLKEVQDRARRTETRLTTYLNSQGHDTRVTRPRFDPIGMAVFVPSPDCSTRDVIESIPDDMRESEIAVKIGNEVIGYVRRV
jgi:hypothetical protein